MPRLLLVTTVPATLAAFLAPFAAHFRRRGWTVDALTGEIPPELASVREQFDSIQTARWSRNAFRLSNVTAAVQDVRRCVSEGDYDIIHVHTPIAAFVTRLALRNRRGGVPSVVYTAHGFHFHPGGRWLTNAVYLTLESLAARWTDHLVVMNSDDLDAARRHRIVPSDRLHFMHGIGVDTERYAPSPATRGERASVLAGLGLRPDDRFLLMVAELVPGKRHADAIAAFERIAPRWPDVHLLFAGDGPLEGAISSLVRSKGLSGRVRVLGFRPDVPELLRSADALVLPSQREGLPRCILEAFATGLPCVATDIRGTRDLLGEGCGWLFPVGDVERFAVALTELLMRPDLARAIAERARRKVERYDLRRVVSQHEELYARALGERHAPRAA